MARIAAIETFEFRLPMYGELRWGSQSSMAEARHVLVKVRLDDGSEGVAEAPPRPTIYGETATTIGAIVREELVPRLVGQPAQNAWACMGAVRNNQTAKGAIDMAVHDALAQSEGQTLAERLGASWDAVRVSYILGIGERDEVLAEAERVVALRPTGHTSQPGCCAARDGGALLRGTAAGRAGAGACGAARPGAVAGHCRRQCFQPTRFAA